MLLTEVPFPPTGRSVHVHGVRLLDEPAPESAVWCGARGERVMSTRVQEKDGNAHERGEDFVGLELWEFFLVVEEFLGEGSCG